MDLSQLDVRTLTVEERQELMGALWDSLVADGPGVVLLLPEQEAVIRARLAAHDSHPTGAQDWPELRKAIRERRQR